MAEKDACIASCRAWRVADVQALRARQTCVLTDLQDRQQAKLTELAQQLADMQARHEAQQAEAARQAAIALQQLKDEHESGMGRGRSARQAEFKAIESSLRNAQANVHHLQQALAAKEHQAEQARHRLQLEVCSWLHYVVQQGSMRQKLCIGRLCNEKVCIGKLMSCMCP